MNDVTLLITNFFALFMESAPWLLMGLLVAGIMHELVPVSLLQKHMGDRSFGAIGKAAIIGAPLPLCSCGVIPAALGLRRSGASRPATVSFLVATPETGVDSVSVSYALLGPLYAIVRPIAAIFSAIYAGTLVKLFGETDSPQSTPALATPVSEGTQSCCSSEKTPKATESCCSSSAKTQNVESVSVPASCCSTEKTSATSQPAVTSCCGSTKTEAPVVESSCCGSTESKKLPEVAFLGKVGDVFSFASGKLLSDITLWLLIGLALAAAIQTWVPTDFLTQWGDGFVAMAVMAVIGIPMYICATASTPLAVGFLSAGISPGAILVFLLAGPATNISTMGMIGRELGKRSLVLYLISIFTASIGLGYLMNWAVASFGWESLIRSSEAAHQHGAEAQTVYVICALILGGLILRNLWQNMKPHLPKWMIDNSKPSSSCH